MFLKTELVGNRLKLLFLIYINLHLAVTNLTTLNTTYVDEEENITSTGWPSFQNVSESDYLNTTETSVTHITITEETSSRIINFSSTSKLPTTVSTTASDVTTTIPTSTPSSKLDRKQKKCNCDLSKECDINCCCDNDCSEIDKNVFGSCFPDTYNGHHTGLCYSSKYLYKNNTGYKVLKEEKGLLCIAQDNLPERLQYSNQKILSTFSTFNKIWNRNKHFFWSPLQQNDDYKFRSDHYYKYGEPIWKFHRPSTMSSIDVPVSLYSNICEDYRTIKYLENFESSCLIKPFPSREFCENNRALNAENLMNILLISNPLFINTSNPEATSEDNLVPVHVTLCDEEKDDCPENHLITKPSYDNSAQLCKNIVQSVHYVIKHNGSAGIVEVNCLIKLQNLSLNEFFKQEYKVSFEWAKNESYKYERSGTPGYLDGKPLICGTSIKRKVNEKIEDHVEINHDGKQWLTFPRGGISGLCDDGRINVLFKHNLLSECKIKLKMDNFTKTCEHLHLQVWNLLFNGYKINASNPQQLNILISSQGDPVPESLKEWVPVFFESPIEYDFKRSHCPTLISGIRLHILYSYYGPVTRPQAKIIGVLAKTYTSKLFCANSDFDCLFKISASVTFTDVTQKAVNKFAKPPIIKIKLPSDFFYPFTSTANHKKQSFLFVLNMLVILRKC